MEFPIQTKIYSNATVKDALGIFDASGNLIVQSVWGGTIAESDENAMFVVRACNSHAGLLFAAQAALSALQVLKRYSDAQVYDRVSPTLETLITALHEATTKAA